MTRENKLALIIGFSLILVVAILITDHLSPAQSAEFANLTPPEISSLALRSTLPSSQSSVRSQGQSANANAAATRNNSIAYSNSNPNRRQSNARREPERVLNLQPASAAVQLENQPIEMGLPINQNQPRNNTQPNYQPEVRLHAVQPNESLYGITRKYYGDTTLARALANFNAGRVSSDLQLRAGITLRIPERWVLTGGSASLQLSSPITTPTPRSTQAPQYTTYVIKSSDTLGEVSMALLGTSRRWREIYQLNRNIIDDPDHLTPGDTIHIPPRRR